MQVASRTFLRDLAIQQDWPAIDEKVFSACQRFLGDDGLCGSYSGPEVPFEEMCFYGETPTPSGQLAGADLPIETDSFLQRVAFTSATLVISRMSYMDEL